MVFLKYGGGIFENIPEKCGIFVICRFENIPEKCGVFVICRTVKLAPTMVRYQIFRVGGHDGLRNRCWGYVQYSTDRLSANAQFCCTEG